MSRRRSRLEIILIILAAIRKGVDKPTRIMYAANMSWRPSQRMLSRMMEQGLVEVRISPRSRRRYVITEKGINMIDYFEKANEILSNDVYLTGQYSFSYSRLP